MDDDKRLPGNGDNYFTIESAGSTPEQKVSWQVIQAVYNHMTGKTEALSNNYELPIQINMGRLGQLNNKIVQISEQYTIQASNCSVTVFHQNDSKEEFSSFDRFKLYNASINSPVERVEIKYEILKTLPKTNKIQRYSISILLISGVVAESEIREIRKSIPGGFMAVIGYDTAILKINYVDYVVAKNYQTGIEEWLKSTAIEPMPKPIEFLKKHSNFIRIILKYVILLSIIYSIYKLVPQFVTDNSLISFTYFSIWSWLAVFFGYKVGVFLSYHFRLTLNNYSPLTFIDLNAGDKREIEKSKVSRKKNKWKALGTFSLNIICAIIGTYLHNLF